MPATEQTWRDTNLMHVVFGVSSLLMLLTTVWMLAADHTREWKGNQRTFRDIESWTASARKAQEDNTEYEKTQAELEKKLAATLIAIPPAELVAEFRKEVESDAARRNVSVDTSPVQQAYEALSSAEPDARPNLRTKFLAQLDRFVALARFRETNALTKKKFRSADLDVARSKYDIAVGEDKPPAELADLQKQVDAVKQDVDELLLAVQDATEHRKALETIVTKITADEMAARKELDNHLQEIKRLDDALAERQLSWGESLLQLPIIDAFGRPLKIDQIWLPKLTINYNFRDVARFDRCITCHQGIDRTAPGSSLEPGYVPQSSVRMSLDTPEKGPAELDTADASQRAKLIEQIYGIRFADRGLLKRSDVTVSVVRPGSAAAKAKRLSPSHGGSGARLGLRVGDVITQIKDVTITGPDQAAEYLLDRVTWHQPIELTVRRGLPEPYVSHPRLDLFVGSVSPHKSGEIGCTICHEGQGSATSFKWASHTPNDPRQASDWGREHGWFDNHHWIFPMNPARFAESSCLKCHHDVTELGPSERFADPPAPKLMAGYNLIREYGCFGCHEINGNDGPTRRIGPDMRLEPNYVAAAQAILASDKISAQQRRLAEDLLANIDDKTTRHRLGDSLKPADKQAVPTELTKLAGVLDDVETPGQMRKVGPSLRHVGSKLDFEFLYSWIRKPTDFRPNTKMPQFFELYDHLNDLGLKESQRFEPLEIRGVVEYLLHKSQPFNVEERGTSRGSGDVAQGSAERGKKLFETRGCLACHKHRDFPGGQMHQGPDLSQVGAKLGNDKGAAWLVSWLREPSRYHPRTLMPNLLLEMGTGLHDQLGAAGQPPRAGGAAPGNSAAADTTVVDIAAYLLSSRGAGGSQNASAWQPQNVPDRAQLSDDQQAALRDLALLHLRDKFPRTQANRFIKEGIPADRSSEIKGDEQELLGNDMSNEKLLVYVGRRTISKYGCYGCHDIPGYEDAKPIGTGLADWGRKGTDKLAFEQIAEYVLAGHGHGGAHPHASSSEGHAAESTTAEHTHVEHTPAEKSQASPAAGQEETDKAPHSIDYDQMSSSQAYFMNSLLGHGREGFIWQKLRAPRSYDFEKTQNKGYNERLRMPLFTAFGETDREAIITFVRGLVAEPPVSQYVYHAEPKRQAVVEGRRILEKYNCTGCHSIAMDKWKLAYAPADFDEPSEVADYPFLTPQVGKQDIDRSLATDAAGLRHATVVGRPIYSPETGKPQRLDEDEAPIEAGAPATKAFYRFMLWDNALVNGHVWQGGIHSLLVPEDRIEEQYQGEGGHLARLLYPAVIADERKVNPNVKPDEAWGWLPPPLVHEGLKVQSDWLHDFLLDPYPIRPAVVLRMPKFNMSSDEAGKLAGYFAAVDNAEYPYDFNSRTRSGYLSGQEARHGNRLRDALNIIVDNNYCIKCHLVGDFSPTGSDRAKAPRLDQVYKRLRAEYLLPWIANPKRLLPYTGMPVNIPPATPVNQQLFHGNSGEQLNGIVDLLLNYDHFAESRTSIRPLVKPAAPAPATPPPGAPGAAAKPQANVVAPRTAVAGG